MGAPATAVVLGRPLDFQTLLRLQPGEPLEPRCVQAEVALGDRRLPSNAVRVDVEPAGPDRARVRVRTTPVVDEPTVSVQLHAGCENRVSRMYVLMADPAVMATAPAVAQAPVNAPAAAPVPATAATAPVRAAAAAAPRSLPPAVASPAARTQRVPSQGAQPRLRLDPADSTGPAGLVADEVVEQALQAVALAASATRAAQAQAQAQAQRIAELERTVGTLQARATAAESGQQAALDRAERAELQGRWFMPLLVGAVVLALLALWLALQLRQQRRLRQTTWMQARADAAATESGEARPSRQPTVPVPLSGREATMPGRLTGSGSAVSAWPAASVSAMDTLPPQEVSTAPGALPVSSVPAGAGAAPLPAARAAAGLGAMAATVAAVPTADAAARALQRTDVLPYGAGSVTSAPRDVSIEELIDLEQQAEFFIVLGQDESAIDLLVEHLRSTGGGSPLPYLKLLEIYRRRGDREAYERTRTRFNHRFNAYAPEWTADPAAGRSLEDYTDVMPRLQQVWARPLDAMAELEALLFRKSRGELFDLPAYREVLFLYALARDLLDREAADTGSVDLLLPLTSASAAAGALAHDADRWASADSDFGDDASRPTAPVDLDLTLPDAPRGSIFDPLLPGRSRS
jgi:pilus assembly protein FimV